MINEELKESIINYCESEEIEYRDSNHKIQLSCINEGHEDNNASSFINLEQDSEFFHCSSCGYHLNSDSLYSFFIGGELSEQDKLKRKLRKLKQLKPKENIEQATEKVVFLPPKLKNFSDFLTKINKETYRGISKETFDKVQAYITPSDNYYQKRTIFPMYSVSKGKPKLESFEAVKVGNPPKILKKKGNQVIEVEPPKILRPSGDNSHYFGFEHLISNSKYPNLVFICEGLYSALSLQEIGLNGLINFGVGVEIEKVQALFDLGVTHVVLFGDKDEAGRKLNGKYYRLLKKSFEVTYFKHPYSADEKSDGNDYLEKGILKELVQKTCKRFYKVSFD